MEWISSAVSASSVVVGVKNHHQVAVKLCQSGGHIAGLGVFVLRAGGIDNPEIAAERLQFGPPRPCLRGKLRIRGVAALIGAAVIAKHNRPEPCGIDHILRRRERDGEHLNRLVVRRHQNIHRRHLIEFKLRRQAAIHRIGRNEGVEEEDEDRIGLNQQKQQGQNETGRQPRIGQG